MGHMGYQDNEERAGITGCYAMIGVALFAFDLSDPALPIRKRIAVSSQRILYPVVSSITENGIIIATLMG
jgi:hypothetical protein